MEQPFHLGGPVVVWECSILTGGIFVGSGILIMRINMAWGFYRRGVTQAVVFDTLPQLMERSYWDGELPPGL